MVERGGSETLADLPNDELLDRVADRGALHLAGFDATESDFTALCERLCDGFTCDPGKVVSGGLRGRGDQVGRAARVLSRAASKLTRQPLGDDEGHTRYAPFGGFGINPHSENSFLPLASPDLVAFLCLRPAATGGDSILADGVEMLERLDEATRSFLRSTPVRYESTLTEPQWRSVWATDDLEGLLDRLQGADGVTSVRAHGRDVTIVFDRLQLASTRFQGAETVRTNLLSRHPFDGIGRDHLEQTASGERVDDDVLAALLDSTRPQTTLRLAAGDVLLIDNTRVLHGRTPFDDTERRVITRCGWLSDNAASLTTTG